MHLSAADRLLIVGDATWGGWSLDRTSVMLRDNSNENVFRYTGWLEADKEFKFLARAQWDGTEYRTASFEGMNDDAFYGGGYNGQRINHNTPPSTPHRPSARFRPRLRTPDSIWPH